MILIWVAAYGAVFTAAQRLAPPGQGELFTALGLGLYWMALFLCFRGRMPNWCRPKFFCLEALPLLLIPALNLPVSPPSLWEALVIVLCAWGEEVLFRGVVLFGLRKHGVSEGGSAFLSSLLFALMHLANIFSAPGQVLYALALGFCFAALALGSRSIFPGFVIHSLINLASPAVPTMGRSAIYGLSAACLLYGLWLSRAHNTMRNSR